MLITSMTDLHFMVRRLLLQFTKQEGIFPKVMKIHSVEEGIGVALDIDRFKLGQARVGFEGAADQEIKEGPVQFEKDNSTKHSATAFKVYMRSATHMYL